MRGLVRTWICCSIALLGMSLCWTLANPITAPPDEPTHVIRADALAHGQLIGKPGPAGTPRVITTVIVPQVIARLQADAACLDQGPSVPARCLQHPTGSQQQVAQGIYVGRYPPAYYAVVGAASYASQGPKVVYLMRVITALLVSVLGGLALAMSDGRPRRSSLAVVGPLVAVTPMVLNLAGSVNPNGPEIAAAVCLWVALAGIGLAPHNPPRYLVVSAATAASGLVLLRGLSPLWLLLAVASAAPLIDRSTLIRLFHRLDARIAAITVAVATAVALAWIVAADALAELKGIPIPVGTTEPHLFRIAVDHLYVFLKQAVGDFGRLDTPVPIFCVVVVCAVVATLVVLSLVRSSSRARVALSFTLLASVGAPVIAILLTGRRLGLVEQGRYFLPLWVGIPILAAASFGSPRSGVIWTWRLRRALVILVAASDLVSFYGGLRRYTVGINGPLSPFTNAPGAWRPPIPPWALDAGFLAAAALLVTALWGRRQRPGTDAQVHDGELTQVAA